MYQVCDMAILCCFKDPPMCLKMMVKLTYVSAALYNLGNFRHGEVGYSSDFIFIQAQ